MLNSNAPTNAPISYSGLNVGSSQMDMPVPIFWGTRRLSTNAIWFGDFTKKPANAKGKGGGAKSQQSYNYYANVILGLCEGVVDSIQNVWAQGSTTTTTTLSALGLIFFSGTISQTPWSLVATKHPTQARAYSQLAYLGAPGLALGASATIPDNGFECVRTALFGSAPYSGYTPSSPGWINPATYAQATGYDCLPSDCIVDLLTSTQYGFNFTSGDIASVSLYAAYCQAQGILFSPLLNRQEKVTSILDRWAQLSNSWIYWDGTALRFLPLGDVAITANGATYTPATDVAYNLTLADFIAETGSDSGPVTVTRKDPADCQNRTCLSITDRTLGYIDNPFEWKDDFLASRYGLRDTSSIQGDEICNPAVAKVMVQLLGKRNAYIRNEYAFKTSFRYIRCLPGTVVTLTEPNIGLNAVRVRIKTISEDENGHLNFTAEEFPGTVGVYSGPSVNSYAVGSSPTPTASFLPWTSAPSNYAQYVGAALTMTSGTYAGQTSVVLSSTTSGLTLATALAGAPSTGDTFTVAPFQVATTPNQYAAPGNVNTPAIVEPSSAFTGGVAKLIVAASGGANWGGCQVLVSFDGTDYSLIGEITAPARQGVLTANLATYGGANPDNVHTLAVDCSQSLGAPTTVSNADAQANRTLSLIAAQPTLTGGAYVVPTNGELLSFGAVSATGTYTANLTYLERGQFGSAVGAHSTGDQFTLLNVAGSDGTSISYALPAQYIGVPIYIKLCSFNVFGNSLQDPSTVLEYKYTPTGAGYGGGTAGVPVTPTGLSAAAANPGQAALSWNANAATDNVTAYLLYRGTTSTFGSASLIWTGQTLGYTDTPGAGTFYYFLVAKNAAGSSTNTAGVSVSVTSSAAGVAVIVATAASSPYAGPSWSAETIYLRLTNISGGALEIDLASSPASGQVLWIMDVGGTAGTNAWTIKQGATVVDTINVNGGYSHLLYDGSAWGKMP